MPLVSRTSTQGNFFKEDEEPSNWQDSDLWSDTNASPRALFINNDGTALQLGSFSVDEIQSDQPANVGAGGIAPNFQSTLELSATFVEVASVTVTVDEDESTVFLVAYAAFGSRNGTRTCHLRVQEGTTDRIADTTVACPVSRMRSVFANATLTGVSSGSHTYDLDISSDSATESACFQAGIKAIVVK